MTKLQNQLNVYLAVEAGVRVRLSLFIMRTSLNVFIGYVVPTQVQLGSR